MGRKRNKKKPKATTKAAKEDGEFDIFADLEDYVTSQEALAEYNNAQVIETCRVCTQDVGNANTTTCSHCKSKVHLVCSHASSQRNGKCFYCLPSERCTFCELIVDTQKKECGTVL